MELERLLLLTQKYLRGEATPEEKALLDAWYYSFEGKDLPVPATAGRTLKKTLRKALFPHPLRYWYWGAAALLLLAAGFFTFRPSGNRLTVAVAAKAFTILPDSSKVWVNAASTVSYKPRELRLSGEAFFDIAHDSLHPFIIHAGTTTVTVLGTAFNVKAYPGQPVVVTVTRGKVRVETAGHVAVLAPGQQVVAADTAWHQTSVDANLYNRWKDGVLQFTDEPFTAVAPTLERRYNIHIDLMGDSVGALRSTAAFDGTATAEQVLRMLCSVHQLQLKKTAEDAYVIEP